MKKGVKNKNSFVSFLKYLFWTKCDYCNRRISGVIKEDKKKYYCEDCYYQLKNDRIQRKKDKEKSKKKLEKIIKDGFKGVLNLKITIDGKVKDKIKIKWVYYLESFNKKKNNTEISGHIQFSDEKKKLKSLQSKYKNATIEPAIFLQFIEMEVMNALEYGNFKKEYGVEANLEIGNTQ